MIGIIYPPLKIKEPAEIAPIRDLIKMPGGFRLRLSRSEAWKILRKRGFKKMRKLHNYCKYIARDRRIHIQYLPWRKGFYYHMDNH